MIIFLSMAVLPVCTDRVFASKEAEIFGPEPNPTDGPVGGGEGYKARIRKADFKVKTLQELLGAFLTATPGQVVYVENEVEIDLTGQKDLQIPWGVTLAGSRGENGSKGALLFTTKIDTFPLFVTHGNSIRITGLRFRGPDPERRNEELQQLMKENRYYSIPTSNGIQVAHRGFELDNCELWGWSHSAIFLKKGASGAHIHHNFIHHNQRYGLGYGVMLDDANAIIEANLFDWNRHCVAGTGKRETSYEARYNIVLENTNSFIFDMHGGADRNDGTDIAGNRIAIHHNMVKAVSYRAVGICGRPLVGAEIHHNWFYHKSPEDAVTQIQGKGNMHVYRNKYTPDGIVKD
jgi:hypothetical protein